MSKKPNLLLITCAGTKERKCCAEYGKFYPRIFEKYFMDKVNVLSREMQRPPAVPSFLPQRENQWKQEFFYSDGILKPEKPDLVLVTGAVCLDAENTPYELVALAKENIAVAIMGNGHALLRASEHDELILVRKKLVFESKKDGEQLVFRGSFIRYTQGEEQRNLYDSIPERFEGGEFELIGVSQSMSIVFREHLGIEIPVSSAD